jgi:dihydroorotate dehydrogenase electron transfer subunit
MQKKNHRGTIFVEDALILSHEEHEGEQFVLRVHAPKCAADAKPGQFAHLQVDLLQPLRRPISIMRTSVQDGWVDFLYKRVGQGTSLLSQRQAGESISIMGPIGNRFEINSGRSLLIGGGVGMPPMICLADELRTLDGHICFAVLGSEVPFPFTPKPSQHIVAGMDEGVIAAMPLLDDWGIASRLASLQGYAGCQQGYVTDVARNYLAQRTRQELDDTTIYSCGPHPMLQAVVDLAREFDINVQTSLEEFMACAVGGCAGCVVPVESDAGVQMKRVCVDGPVFDGRLVFSES